MNSFKSIILALAGAVLVGFLALSLYSIAFISWICCGDYLSPGLNLTSKIAALLTGILTFIFIYKILKNSKK